MSDLEAFAARLNKAMKLNGFTHFDLAAETGITDRMIRNYLNAKYKPSAFSAKLLADALDVSADWLLGKERYYD